MRYIILILIFPIIYSCIGNPGKKSIVFEKEEHSLDSIENHVDTLNYFLDEKSNRLFTKRFFSLITYIDSMGYKFDTNRYNPPVKKIFLNGYVFYDYRLDEKEQYRFYHAVQDDSLELYPERITFKIEPFEKASKIVSYYYCSKVPRVKTFGGKKEKWYTDGIIDEWEFPSEFEAKQAFLEMKMAEPIIYFNCGAYYFFDENYLYIFHTRASGFMPTLKLFYDYFKVKIKNCADNKYK